MAKSSKRPSQGSAKTPATKPRRSAGKAGANGRQAKQPQSSKQGQPRIVHGKVSTSLRGVEEPATGYSIYNPAQKTRTRRNTLDELYPPLPNEKYAIIYADPPWDYNGKMQFDRTSSAQDAIDLSKNIFISSAAFKYPTLKLPELKKLRVPDIAEDDALLFMWATNPHLNQAIELGEAWGFQYRTVVFVWNKMVHNPGKYTLSYCELCLLFKRGRIPGPRGARNIKQLINAPRGEHSEKPAEVARNIELMFPESRRIELFARTQAPGWAAWGLEAKDAKVRDAASALNPLQQQLL